MFGMTAGPDRNFTNGGAKVFELRLRGFLMPHGSAQKPRTVPHCNISVCTVLKFQDVEFFAMVISAGLDTIAPGTFESNIF